MRNPANNSSHRVAVIMERSALTNRWLKSEPLPKAILAGLRQAQQILGWAHDDVQKRPRATALQLPASSEEPPTALVTATVSLQTEALNEGQAVEQPASRVSEL
jgi:hypothetical protein